MSPPDRWPPIGRHRLLGDGTTTALLQPDGTVDWWCAPEMDSPPLLWSLLDPAGTASRYLDAHLRTEPGEAVGPSLTSGLRIRSVAVEALDGLVTRDGVPVLVRLLRAVDADLDVVHQLELGGFDQPTARWEGRVAHLATTTVLVSGGEPGDRGRADGGDGPVDGRAIRLRAGPGQWAALTITAAAAAPAGAGIWPGTDAVELDPDALADELKEARRRGDASIPWARLPRRHRDHCADAIKVVEACTLAATGGLVASPTTSLPEARGGDRQWDYRYSWLRDSSLALAVTALLGATDTAGRYVRFLRRLGADGILDAPLHTVRGGPVPEERTVDGVAGWEGTGPVRVGNAASEQVQFDALGFVLDGLSLHLSTGARLDSDLWDIVVGLTDRCTEDVGQATSGIWELRQPADLVAADIGRWVTLDRAVRIARRRRPWVSTRRWRRGRRAARDRILGALTDDGLLPQAYGGTTPDGSGLLLVVLGLLRRRDPRARRLIDRTVADLGVSGFLHRYPPPIDDGLEGREGAFVPVSWWLVSALALTGRLDEATDAADRLCRSLPPLMSEEWDPDRGEALGNTPLLWSHMEAARALYLLDEGRRRQRWGRAGVAVWRAARRVRTS